MNLIRTIDKSLWVDDNWLTEKTAAHEAYIDVKELQRGEGQYYDWLITKYGKYDADQHVIAALLTFTGIRINDDTNYWVKCRMASDKTTYRRYFAPGVTHPNMIQRIYAYGTTARGIEIVGLSGVVA
jgi:hypothetical protein